LKNGRKLSHGKKRIRRGEKRWTWNDKRRKEREKERLTHITSLAMHGF